MHSLLLIQFRMDKSLAHERVCMRNVLRHFKNVDILPLSALDDSIAWRHPEEIVRDFDGVIFGGSGEFNVSGEHKTKERAKLAKRAIRNVRPLVRYILKKDFPAIGICFGHQLLSHILGTPVVRDVSQAKTAGSYRVRLTREGKRDDVFQDIPETFFAQYAHKESLSALPKGATLLAKNGNRCKTSAFRFKRNVYGVQFHPELTEKDLSRRLSVSEAEYAGRKRPVRPTVYAQKILQNFVRRKIIGNRKMRSL